MSLKALERGRSIFLAVVLIGACASGLHAGQIQRTRSPHGNLDIACQNCHASESWRPIRAVPDFNHNSQTEYPLLGEHKTVACAGCHVNPVFSETEASCASCHADIHRRQFGASCEGCHTVRGWRISIDSIRQHANRFPLAGSHAAATCESCHRGAASGTFTGLSASCISCHAADYAGTRSIDHRAAGFSTNCETCHTLNQWRSVKGGGQFDHSHTQFPLLGAHASASCISCHTQGKFAGTDSSCVSCHIREYSATTHPNHTAAAFSQDCRSCHTSAVSWQDTTFNHSATRFALSGAHSSVQCASCHAGNRFAGTSTTCSSCHTSAFNSATNPNHAAAGFPQDCVLCHTTNAWRPVPAFDHSRTRFMLLGAHASATCESCHAQNRFTGTSSSCVSCHLSDFNGTAKPNHTSAGFSQECQSCHSLVSWQGATFDHNRTRFPLTGAHSGRTCVSCHAGNQFAGTTTTCNSCHIAAFNSATNPNHVSAGLPQDCLLCHGTSAWRPASFDHSRTRFPLLGAHMSTTCASCHVGGKYVGTPTTCVSCHLAKYTATTSPNHVAAGFPQECQLCHTSVKWQGAVFDHGRTRFPLMGAHTTVLCANCHVGNKFAGTPTACYSCHASEFKTVTNPNHVAAGFPTSCESCHTTTTWSGAKFTHKFPIYSGAHSGKWQSCNDCHTNASNYAVFSCLNCHEHERTKMDSKHKGKNGYVYDSLACYGCHPNGKH